MESRHCGQDKGIFFCPVHNASTPCSPQGFGIRCIVSKTFEQRIDDHRPRFRLRFNKRPVVIKIFSVVFQFLRVQPPHA